MRCVSLFQANVGQARCKENAFIRVLMDSIADSAIKGENKHYSALGIISINPN